MAILQSRCLTYVRYVLISVSYLCNRAGLQRPTVEVRFENISVIARVLVGQRGQDTVLNYYGKCIAVSCVQNVQRGTHD